ncbi:MAG TPA: hypothetical protein VFP43_12655, partial [Mesorhizobium sp.]|nr:hypothetical protein [Mesorhizobium sp.]
LMAHNSERTPLLFSLPRGVFILSQSLVRPDQAGRLVTRQKNRRCGRPLAAMLGGGTWEGAHMPSMRRRDVLALLGGAAAD